MSYQCDISFKSLEPDKVFAFLQDLKATLKNSDICISLGKDFQQCGAVSQLTLSEQEEHFGKYKDFKSFYLSKDPYDMLRINAAKEAMDACMRFKWFYIPEEKLLGMFGVPKTWQPLFDNTTFFQNCSDHDYDWNEWNGIPMFERCVQRAQDISVDGLKFAMGLSDDDLQEGGEDYWRKSLVYDLVWSSIEKFLWDDGRAVYISFLGYYDLQARLAIMRSAYESYQEWWKEMQKDFKKG